MIKKLVRENLVSAAQPTTKPGVKPGTKPGAPSPIRRERPSVTPKPKASAEDVATRFLNLLKKNGIK